MGPVRQIVLTGVFALSFFASAGRAQDVIVYDDVLQNGFLDYSFNNTSGDLNFANTNPFHGGAKSIAFRGNATYNAVSFFHPISYNTSQYPTVHFWVHGGTTGGQQLRIYLQNSGVGVANAPLGSYITGGSIAANVWREVTVNLGAAPLSYSGPFDRIDLQTDLGVQPFLYIDDISLVPGVAPPAANLIQIERDVAFDAGYPTFLSDRFTWRDAANKPRVAVLTHNDPGQQQGPTAAGGYPNRGGALREFRYQLADDTTRIATMTTYGNGGYGGFGYVVSHSSNYAGCVGDDSPLGYGTTGQWQRLFEGRHHVIFRFTQSYPRACSTTAPVTIRTIPVTIDWVFSTGRDNPIWAITYDVDAGGPVNTFYDDSRAPYGELNIDGQGFQDIDGVAWGDRYKFASTTVPVTLNSSWTWSTPNTVPYVKEWINGPIVLAGHTRDATMGIVQTQTMSQQDAAGARIAGYHDVTPFWGRDWLSVVDNAGNGYKMPWQDDWPYQANANSLGTASSSNNARLTWRTQYGFLGQSAYTLHDPANGTAPGYPKKSYSTHIVLGQHTAFPVEAQVTQVETVQSLALNATIGSRVASGPAGITRADNVTFAPPGYNHVYGALAFNASGNALDATLGVGSGSLKNPLVIVGNYTAGLPVTVKLAGATLASDVDYFASIRGGSNELWLTLNRTLSVGTNPNRLEILNSASPPPSGMALRTLSPCRLIDTRNATGPDAGAPSLAANGTRVISPVGKCGIPGTARALSANITITAPAAAGGLLLYPADLAIAPVASSINFRRGETRANNDVLLLATDGTGFKVLNASAGAVHFILDVNGWFE